MVGRGIAKPKIVRMVAAAVLRYMGAPGQTAIPALIKALSDTNPVHDMAASALARMGPPALSPLIAALNDENPSIRSGAAAALGQMGEAATDAVPALIKALDDTDASVHRSASEALKNIGTPEAMEAAEDL